jgi:hypothetical protein
LASSELVNQISGITEWHINADEPHVLDYNTEFKSLEQITSLYNADSYRASDHDPVIVGINMAPPPATTMHVGDLGADAQRLKHGKWRIEVTIEARDDRGNVVEGVTVNGTWRARKEAIADSCVTDANGVCEVTLTVRKNNLPRTYVVNALSHDTLTYDPAANTDPDDDSDGTTIDLRDAIIQAWLDWLQGLLKGIFT